MAALPYIQIYVADYLADTMHLTAEEHGAYLLLIFNYWQTGKPIPKSRLQKIARIPNDRWTTVEESLSEFFTDDGENWIHDRIERDLQAVRETQEQRAKAGKASAEARKASKSTKRQRKSNTRSTPVEDSLNGKPTNKDTDTDTDTDSGSRARGDEKPAPKYGQLDLSSLPEPVPEQSARDFIDHRKTIKRPMSQKALALCMNAAAKASEFGLTPELVIEEAITRGWMKPEPKWVQNRLRDEGRLTSGTVTQFPDQSRREYIENNNVPRNKEFPAEYLQPRRGA